MNKYLIQDSEDWLSHSVFDTIEEARERIEWFKIEHNWESVEYFIILVLDTEWNSLLEIDRVYNKRRTRNDN